MPRSNLFDYFFILRPLILIPVWNFLLIGAYLAYQRAVFTFDVLIGLVIYTLVMGGVYILNQLMDIETDRINKKLFLLSSGHITKSAAYTELAFLWACAIVMSIRFGWLFAVLIIVSMALGVAYSVPPVKLKGKPVVDTLANALGYGTVNFAIGWLLVRDYGPSMFVRFLPYVLCIAAVFINTTIVDIEGDRKAGERTTGVFLGAAAAHVVSCFVMAAAIVVAYLRRDHVCLIPAAISLPLFIYAAGYALWRKSVHRKATIVSFRLPGLAFTVITAILFPVYALVLAVVFVAMRVYYRLRFDMAYPTLSGG